MLSNITSYLFGGQASTASPEKENVNFHEVEDDDWMIIDKLAEMRKSSIEGDDLIVSSETFISDAPSLPEKQPNSRPPVPDNKGSRRRSISCKRLVNRRCSTPLRELSPTCVNTKAVVPYAPKKESRSSSKSSACGMEESWYITPPPCFVSGPYETKPSSLENLLIEQPGVMYVGRAQRPARYQLPQPQQREQIEELKLTKEELQDLKLAKESNNVRYAHPAEFKSRMHFYETLLAQARHQRDHRQQLLEMHEQKKFINSCQSQISAGQKVEQKLPGQVSKRNQMERMNKVQHELSSRKKRQRRADLTNKKHSGVNNNRKCCY